MDCTCGQDQLRRERAEWEAGKEAHNLHVVQQNEQLSGLEAERARLSQSEAGLKTKLLESEGLAVRLKASLGATEEVLASVEAAHQRLRSECDTLSVRLGDAETALGDAKSANMVLSGERDALLRRVEAGDEEREEAERARER